VYTQKGMKKKIVAIYIISLILSTILWYYGITYALVLTMSDYSQPEYYHQIATYGLLSPYIIFFAAAIGSYFIYHKKIASMWLRIGIFLFFLFSSLLPMASLYSYLQIANYIYETRVKTEGVIHDGLNVRHWYGVGIVRSKENYKNGVKDGKQEYYAIDGELEKVENYKNGELDGIQKEYSAYGKLIKKSEYKNGMPISIISYDRSSGKISKRVEYQNGIVVLTEIYNKKGILENRYEKSPDVENRGSQDAITPASGSAPQVVR
jgi:antitoxin component YwqK of YwqJK toxin-antitoxin module